MTIKQKIDKYLKDNYGDVLFETKVKGFRWQTIADKIGKDINKDLVKDRWKVVKKKIEIENREFISNSIKESNAKVEEKTCSPKSNVTIPFDVVNPKPKEILKPKFNLITWIKNLFKNI